MENKLRYYTVLIASVNAPLSSFILLRYYCRDKDKQIKELKLDLIWEIS